MKSTFSRRSLLAGCGALPALAGIFDPARRALAAAAPAPKRLLILGRLEGVVPGIWQPTGSETDFQLADVMKPLDPWKSKMIVIDGVNNQTAIKNGYGDTHAPASSVWPSGLRNRGRV